MKTFPKVETANIVQQTVDKELLLYNLTTDKAFCLNQTSAAIYNLCDGMNEIEAIAEKVNLPKEIVQIAVSDLSMQNLLTENFELPTSRRSLLRNAALTAIALPVLTTLVAPTAAHAASTACCMGVNCAPGGFFIGTFPSDLDRGLTVCAEPACRVCRSGRYSTGPGGSTCNNSECTTVTCYCAPVANP